MGPEPPTLGIGPGHLSAPISPLVCLLSYKPCLHLALYPDAYTFALISQRQGDRVLLGPSSRSVASGSLFPTFLVSMVWASPRVGYPDFQAMQCVLCPLSLEG
jgi:hypothetical protein